MQISFERIKSLIVEKSQKSASEIDALIESKLQHFSGLVSKEGAAHIVANELGVSLDTSEPVPINQLAIAKNVTVIATITRRNEPITFKKENGEGKVGSLQVSDASGTTRLTFWNNDTVLMYQFAVGNTYKITNISSKDNRGQIELIFSSKARSELVATGTAPQTTQQPSAVTKTNLKSVAPNDQVVLEALIVQMYKPSFYIVDKQSRKKVLADSFDPTKHDKGFVLSLVIDDGTENMRAVCFRETATQLCNCTNEQFLIFETAPFDLMMTKLLGAKIKISGKITQNQMYNRMEVLINDVKVLD